MDPPPRLTICLAGCRPRPPHPGQLSITYPSDWPPVPHCPPCPGTFKLPTPHNWQMVTWISMKGLWQTVFNRPQTDERVSLTMLFILTMIFDSQRRANCPNFREASLAFPALPHSVAPIHLALGGLELAILQCLHSSQRAAHHSDAWIISYKTLLGAQATYTAHHAPLNSWMYVCWTHLHKTSKSCLPFVPKYLWLPGPIHGKIICSTVSTSQVFPGVGRR